MRGVVAISVAAVLAGTVVQAAGVAGARDEPSALRTERAAPPALAALAHAQTVSAEIPRAAPSPVPFPLLLLAGGCTGLAFLAWRARVGRT